MSIPNKKRYRALSATLENGSSPKEAARPGETARNLMQGRPPGAIPEVIDPAWFNYFGPPENITQLFGVLEQHCPFGDFQKGIPPRRMPF